MLKKISIVPSLILFAAMTSYAGGPDIDTSSPIPKGFAITFINAGFGEIIANNAATFNGATTTQTFDQSSSNGIVPLGAGISYMYMMPISRNNVFEINLNAAYIFSGKNITNYTVDENVAPSGVPVSIMQQNNLLMKSALLFNFKHFFLPSNQFDIFFGLGPGLAYFKDTFTSMSVTTQARLNKGTHGEWVFGGDMNVGIDYWLSKRVFTTLLFDNALFLSKNLKAVYNVDPDAPTNTATVTNRSVKLYVPTVMLALSIKL